MAHNRSHFQNVYIAVDNSAGTSNTQNDSLQLCLQYGYSLHLQ